MNNPQMMIKEAAIVLFSKKGYKETKITDIAKKAGVSTGTIYAYFKGKRELFDSLGIPEMEYYRPEYVKKRREILKVALSVFKDYGYSSTTMDQIAQKCGFTKAFLYQYFTNKEELFKAIFKEPTIIGTLDHLVFEVTDENVENVLWKLGKAFLEMFEDEGRVNLLQIVIAESLRFPELIEIMHKYGIHYVTNKFADYLSIISEKNLIYCENPKMTARAFFGMLYSFVITVKVLYSKEDDFNMELVLRYAVNLFYQSLKVEKQ